MKKKIPPRVVKAVIPEERSARSKKGNKIKECTPSRRARADPLRDEGKISPLFQIQKELRKITIQFHTHLLHHRRGGNLRRVTSLERGGDRGGSSRRTQTHLLGDRLESSGSSYRRHFLFSCCLYSDDVSGFLHSSLPNLPLDFIHFCCPNKQQQFCWTLSLF